MVWTALSVPKGRAWLLPAGVRENVGEGPGCAWWCLCHPLLGPAHPAPRPGRRFHTHSSEHLGIHLLFLLGRSLPTDAGFLPGLWEDGAGCACVSLIPKAQDVKASGSHLLTWLLGE